MITRIERFCATASVLLALTVVIGGQTGGTLGNDDVIKMVRAQLANSIVLTTIEASNVKFDVSPTGLISLKEAAVPDEIIQAMQAKMRTQGISTDSATRSAPEKSELLADAKDPDVILRSFRTLLVDASRAVYFGTNQMKAALGKNKNFAALKLSIVDDPAVADAVLYVTHTFAWDYPFTLKHQNTSVILLSGKGTGPFSGPLGARSVADELVKGLKPYRSRASVK